MWKRTPLDEPKTSLEKRDDLSPNNSRRHKVKTTAKQRACENEVTIISTKIWMHSFVYEHFHTYTDERVKHVEL
uniref:Uncharacterized protein n=1 Tax=Romanomermis culicivorax TaxID=13658 RepID=A0A915JPN1_ROMCU